MSRWRRSLPVFAVCALAAPQVPAQLVANPGFEDPITVGAGSYVGVWDGFTAGSGSSVANSAVSPRSGGQHLDLSIVNAEARFAGIIQDVAGLTSGDPADFRGWHRRAGSPFDAEVEINIVWRNSVTQSTVSQTPKLIPILTDTNAEFSVISEVPDGADTARLVYSIHTFGPEPTNTGTVFVDDMSLVPEPAVTLLSGSALLALAGLSVRRERAARERNEGADRRARLRRGRGSPLRVGTVPHVKSPG